MLGHDGKVVVVQPCPLQPGVGELEEGGSSDVQLEAHGGRQPDEAAGVAGDLGLVEDDVQAHWVPLDLVRLDQLPPQGRHEVTIHQVGLLLVGQQIGDLPERARHGTGRPGRMRRRRSGPEA